MLVFNLTSDRIFTPGWSPIMGLCSANGARHNIFCEYFINRHLQSSWTKLDEGNLNLSWDSYSWQVTSCAQIHHFVSYFSFQFAQSYQMLAHDQIHYYAVTCYNYYLLRNKTEFNWVCCEELKTDWADMMNDVSYHVSPPTSIMAPSVKLSKTVHKIHIWLLLSLQYVIFTLRFSFSVSPVVQLVSPWAHTVSQLESFSDPRICVWPNLSGYVRSVLI